MIAGEKSVGSNGYQNLLFPLSFMYISQREEGDYSHRGTYAIDFLGWGVNGRIYKCPYFAPCDLVAVFKYDSYIIYNSKTKVNFIDGTLDYCAIMVAHDDNQPIIPVGNEVSQGDLLGHTGTYGNVTGDHVHICVVKGHYAGGYYNKFGNWTLNNQYHLYNAMGVNNTNLIRPYEYNWRIFEDTPTPPIIPTIPTEDLLFFENFKRRGLI